MPSVRIEFIKVQQSNKETFDAADNVIATRMADSIDLTVTGTVTDNASRPVVPSTCDAVRLTAIGAPVYADWSDDPTATQAKSIRLVADQPEVFAVKRGHKMSFLLGA